MENVIYNELRKQGYGVDVGVVESFKRDEEGILMMSLYDFLLQKTESVHSE